MQLLRDRLAKRYIRNDARIVYHAAGKLTYNKRHDRACSLRNGLEIM